MKSTATEPFPRVSPRSRKYSTRLACTSCRKKRTKCDGRSPCYKCKAHDAAACAYEKTDQRTKSSLREEAKLLRRSLHESDTIIDALRHSRHRGLIVANLQNGASNRQIAELLQVLDAVDRGFTGTFTGGFKGPLDISLSWADGPDDGSVATAGYPDANPPVMLNPLFGWPQGTTVFHPMNLDAAGIPWQQKQKATTQICLTQTTLLAL